MTANLAPMVDTDVAATTPGHDSSGCLTAWRLDPTEEALELAASERSPDVEKPAPLCTELGRRLLRMQFEFNRWVLRRVEKVEFDHDRRVVRRTSIELRVPDGAPQLQVGADRFWLVPLSVMRRRTLVNLDLHDEHGNSIRMLGLRFAQALDVAMLRAAARLACMEGPSGEFDELFVELDELISQVVTGSREEVEEIALRVAVTRGEPLPEGLLKQRREPPVRYEDPLVLKALDDSLFSGTLERLWHNFTLFTMLPVEDGRQRLIRLCVDEPTDWMNQRPMLEGLTQGDQVTTYRPFASQSRLPIGSILGLTPVRLRFLTPSAENCASYHFEFTAPPGVRIARATLLAGRPQDGAGGVVGKGITVDDITPRGPTAGLHAVEVPNGSLSRAQIDLRVPAQGWLGTMSAAALACLVVVLTVLQHVLNHWGQGDHWSPEQVTNIVLLLVTVSAGSATYVAHQHPHEVAAKMVRGLRFIGALMMAVPALVAGWLVYRGESEVGRSWSWSSPWSWPWSWSWSQLGSFVLVGAVASAGLFLLIIWAAWAMSGLSQRRARKAPKASPWDISGVLPIPPAKRWWRRAADRFGWSRKAADRARGAADRAREATKSAARVRRSAGGFRQALTALVRERNSTGSFRMAYETLSRAPSPGSFHAALEDLGFERAAIGFYTAEGWHERYDWDDGKNRDVLEALSSGDSNPTRCSCGPRTPSTHDGMVGRPPDSIAVRP